MVDNFISKFVGFGESILKPVCGDVQVKNSTHLLWSWHRNQDHYDEVFGDQIYIVRQPSNCQIEHS